MQAAALAVPQNVQAAAPGMAAAVRPQAVQPNQINMNQQQLDADNAKFESQQQLLQMTAALLANIGTKSVASANPRTNNGYAPRVRPPEQQGKLGIVHPSLQLLSGQQLLMRMSRMQSVQNQEENALTDKFSTMSWDERQKFLKQYDLKQFSLYDPLPDNTAVYTVNLLVARNLTERMYQF